MSSRFIAVLYFLGGMLIFHWWLVEPKTELRMTVSSGMKDSVTNLACFC